MTVQELLFSELRKAGATVEGACAVLGNVQAESAFIPTNVEDRSGIADAVYTKNIDDKKYSKDRFVRDSYGYGLAQWTYFSRKANMYEFLVEQGYSIGDVNRQVEFLIWEMRNFYKAQWDLITTSHDLYRCTWDLLDKWENPAEKKNNMTVRYTNAQRWFREFSDWKDDNTIGSIDVPVSTKTWPPRTIDAGCDDFKEVKLLEALLSLRGYNVILDGIFAESLTKKVMEFQEANNLKADGVVGPKTWRKLMQLPSDF